MPKLKKAPRNAYYFFMLDRKQELETRGYIFPGGMKDVANTVYQEWSDMPANDKAYYEEMATKAKKKEKVNFQNKFTATGESFAHVLERAAALQEEEFNIERIVDDLTVASETPAEARNFIVIKTIHSCEVLRPRHSFWPLEIAVAAFNLQDGMQKSYWTLVDTVKVPVGYASAAKETNEETGLPIPGSNLFEEKHRDYKKIIMNIKRFVESFLKNEQKYVLFAMETELKSAEGCIQWLLENADLSPEETSSLTLFVNKLHFYRLPKLLIRFATMAKKRNGNYNHILAVFTNLERSAAAVLVDSSFDYRGDLTCEFHNREEPSIKMNFCCRNVALRRIYLIINEIRPAMLLPEKDGHDIEKFRVFSGKASNPAGGTQRPVPVPGPPSGTPRASYSISAVGLAPKPSSTIPHQESDSLADVWNAATSQHPQTINPYDIERFPDVSVSATDYGCYNGRARMQDGLDIPANKKAISSYETGPGFAAAPPAARFDPPAWGRCQEPQSANFREEGFPALGDSSPANSLWGATGGGSGNRGGRGRGGPLR